MVDLVKSISEVHVTNEDRLEALRLTDDWLEASRNVQNHRKYPDLVIIIIFAWLFGAFIMALTSSFSTGDTRILSLLVLAGSSLAGYLYYREMVRQFDDAVEKEHRRIKDSK